MDDALAGSPADAEFWDRLAARLLPPIPPGESLANNPLERASLRRVTADVERLIHQLLAEVDRALVHFDPSLAPQRVRNSAERASLLAHAAGPLIETVDAVSPERS